MCHNFFLRWKKKKENNGVILTVTSVTSVTNLLGGESMLPFCIAIKKETVESASSYFQKKLMEDDKKDKEILFEKKDIIKKSEKKVDANVTLVTSKENQGFQGCRLGDKLYEIVTKTSPSKKPSFWLIKIPDKVCKCGCDDFKLYSDPEEVEGQEIEVFCANCGKRGLVVLKDFSIIFPFEEKN